MFWKLSGLAFILGLLLVVIGFASGNENLGAAGLFLVVMLLVLLFFKRIVQGFIR